MDNLLWNKISAFDFNSPVSEYGFSTRLAKENFWTRNFTDRALSEYRKFMYLAATSEWMVSPSEIIDQVWHQHLVFTQSYAEFCSLIGKSVQHIPSTQNKEESQKFIQAKERTIKLYNETFGKQPEEIWNYPDMYASLNLPKATFKIRSFIIVGILSFFLLITPFYFLLKPVYIQIVNPDFISGYIPIAGLIFIVLELYNRSHFLKIVRNFKPYTFFYDLQAQELIYLKSRRLIRVIHGCVNRLIEKNKILLRHDLSMQLNYSGKPENTEEYSILESLKFRGPVTYPDLLKELVKKPVFSNLSGTMDAFNKYFIKSKTFGKLFYLNFTVLLLIIMIGTVRIFTGLLRDKPVELIVITTLIITSIAIAYLKRLTIQIGTTTIPAFYEQELLVTKPTKNSWEWHYFRLGNAVFVPAFLPLVSQFDNSSFSSDSSGSCGSGCGSSCSSCGGCGN